MKLSVVYVDWCSFCSQEENEARLRRKKHIVKMVKFQSELGDHSGMICRRCLTTMLSLHKKKVDAT